MEMSKAAAEARVRMIDRAIELDRQSKSVRKELDGIKAVLQSEALEEMENRNQKYVQYFGRGGTAVVCYKDKFEVDNYPLLREIFGQQLEDKTKREVFVKYTLDDKMKKAIIALYRDEAKPHDLKEILSWLGLEGKEANAAVKKLKGDYAKDLKTLQNFNVNTEAGVEEELDAIREQMNYVLAEKYIADLAAVDLGKLKRAVSVEESLSIGLNYEGDVEDGKQEN